MTVILGRVRFRAYHTDEGVDFDDGSGPPPPPPPPPPAGLATLFDNVAVADTGGTQFSADFALVIVPPFATADSMLALSSGAMEATQSDSYAESDPIPVADGAVTFQVDVRFTADGFDPTTGYTGGVEFGPDLFDILAGGTSIVAGNLAQGVFIDYSGGEWQFGTAFSDSLGNFRFGGPLSPDTWYTLTVTLTPTGAVATDPYDCALAVDGVDSGLGSFALNPLGTETTIRVGYIGSVGP